MLAWLADKLTGDLALSRQTHRLLRQALNALDTRFALRAVRSGISVVCRGA